MPVPFYLLCGSLGAGKTTLLMRLLEYWKSQGLRAGVLMNEAGEVSIDGPRAGTIAEQVMNLAGGCVCCDTKEDLSWGIAQLVNDAASDVVIIECSGLADPAEVIDAVTDLYTARLATLERVIALLHPIASETSHSSQYVTAQAIRCADELILNKQDLYVPGHWEGFKSGIVKQNPYARIWETTHARIDAAVIVGDDQNEMFTAVNPPWFFVFTGETIIDEPASEVQLAMMPPGVAISEPGRRPDHREVYPCRPDLARELAARLKEGGYEIEQTNAWTHAGAPANAYGMPHAYSFIYKQIMRGKVTPHVPFFINTFFPPTQPSAGRCVAAGVAAPSRGVRFDVASVRLHPRGAEIHVFEDAF